MSRINGCRKTLEEFKEDVNKIYKNDFQVISNEYINQYTNIKIKHKCGNEFEYTPKYILKGNCKCPFCEEVRCLSINEDLFKKKIKNDFILKSSYKNLTTKVILQCKKCKKEDIYIPNNVLYNKRKCKNCYKQNIRKTKAKEFNQYFKDGKYELKSEYIKSSQKVDILCKKCNNIFKMTPNDFKNGYRCPYCAGNKKKDTNTFKKEIFNLVGNEYEVLSEYKNTNSKVLLKHNKCNTEWWTTPNSFLNGNHRCPYCKRSIGEEKIKNWLKDNNIKFVEQYKFNDCKYYKVLPFDFYLEEYNLLIEFDGIQHFQPIKNFGGEKEFKIQQKRDIIKNNYCNKHDIQLLRINYNQLDNINNIMIKIVQRLSKP